MILKRYGVGLALIICVILSVGTFVDLQLSTDNSSNTFGLEPLTQESMKTSNMVNSPSNGTNANYTWTSWVNASDNDNDLAADTLNVYYNFSNFVISEYFLIELNLVIYIDMNGSLSQIDYDWHEFYEYVEPSNSYLWSYEWRAPEDGNYSMTVHQFVWGEYNTTFEQQEEFSWININKFNIFQEYSVTTSYSDEDQDSFNDSISFTYALNFSSSGFFYLEFVIHILYWDDVAEEWIFLFSDYDYEGYEVNQGEVVNWTYQYKAWYDGDYQFFIWLEDDDNYFSRILVEDTHEWYGAHAFNLLNEWEGVITLLDKDGDSCSDAFSLEYTFNFSYSGPLHLRISIEISYWADSYWNYYDNVYDHYYEDVTAGEEYKWIIEWIADLTEEYQLNVRITDDMNGLLILEETYSNIHLCTYEVISDWKFWTEEIDKDQDGSIDTIILNYGLLFKSAGTKDLLFDLEVEYWENSYSNRMYFTTQFHGEVTTTSYYHCYFEFSAREIKSYDFDVSIYTIFEYFSILKDEYGPWTPIDIFNPLVDWSYSTSEHDLDDDGLIDTLDIHFEFKFSFTGNTDLYIDIEIERLDTDLMNWVYETSRPHQFREDVTAGLIYESTFRFSAPSTADYRLELDGRTGYSSGDQSLFVDTIYWSGNELVLFNDHYFSFLPKDSDSDGQNDSLEAGFNFNCKADQNLLLAFMISAESYNTAQDRWDTVYSPYFPEVHIFQQDVAADTWYSWNYTWGIPFNGTFNISIHLSSPWLILDDIIGSYLFENATKFDSIPFEAESWVIGHDTTYDGLNDSIEFGLSFNFDYSGTVDFNISIDLITLENLYEYTSWNTDYFWYQFSANVSSGNWYDWSTELSLDPSSYGIYLLRVYDRGVPVFYTLGYLFETDPTIYPYSLPLLPVIPPEPTTTTTTTTIPSTTTTVKKITPGWSLAISLLVFTGLIVLKRYRRFNKTQLR